MFKVININGRYAPRIVCDACGKFIEDAGNANVVYHNNPGRR